jgi:hypothetical protein
LGVQKASFFAIAYEHAEELGAFRMGGIILCEKAKCESFAEKRAARNADKSVNNRRKELAERLANLDPDQVEKLLAQM